MDSKNQLSSILVPVLATSIAIGTTFRLLQKPWQKWQERSALQKKAEIKLRDKNLAPYGIVSGLFIHPVKSLRAVAVSKATLDCKGFVGDRRLMIVYPLPVPVWKKSFDKNDTTHRFLSQRQCPSLARVIATIGGDDDSQLSLQFGNKSIKVSLSERAKKSFRASIWDDHVMVDDLGDDVAFFFQQIIDSDENASAAGNMYKGVRMVMHSRTDRTTDPRFTPLLAQSWFGSRTPPVSLSDGFAILIACEASLMELNRRLKANKKDPIDMSRFRANIVIKGTKPFEEDRWKSIVIGNQVFAVVKPCARCKQSCTDQTTGMVHAEPVETMKTFRAIDVNKNEEVFFAQNAIPLETSGTIQVGDAVHVLETGEPQFES